ncbi:ABC transporter ATP-binding protein [Candidatus Neomarinimicrobiota bacterium]
MEPLIELKNVSKSYGSKLVLQGVTLDIPPGRIVGLVGPNGAGKTTLLRSITGEIQFDGEVQILGISPKSQRAALMRNAGVIHDVTVLPPWMKVREVLDYTAGVHPEFSIDRCLTLLDDTSIGLKQRIKQLSKGMKTQLHLALVLATETRLLILDEPTHGLDIIFRKKLYSSVLEDYYDDAKSVLISTHQVEEVEHILSDVIFIREGRILLYTSMDDLREQFIQISVSAEQADEVRKYNPVQEQEIFGRKVFLLRGVDRTLIEGLGEMQVPSVADVFMVLMGGEA